MSLTADVLNYLVAILSQQSVSAADPNFDTTVDLFRRSRSELLLALKSAEEAASGNHIFSPDVLNFLAIILAQQSVSAADPNFDATASLVGRSRSQLLAALTAPAPSQRLEGLPRR